MVSQCNMVWPQGFNRLGALLKFDDNGLIAPVRAEACDRMTTAFTGEVGWPLPQGRRPEGRG